MNDYLVPASLYHFLCGVCSGVFLMLSLYNEAHMWALWASACVISIILSGFFRGCVDREEVTRILRRHGLLDDKSKSNY